MGSLSIPREPADNYNFTVRLPIGSIRFGRRRLIIYSRMRASRVANKGENRAARMDGWMDGERSE